MYNMHTFNLTTSQCNESILARHSLTLVHYLIRYTVRVTAAATYSIIAFHDNSSAIRGCIAPTLGPEQPGKPSKMVQKHPLHHPILTAETHNFPTGVAPFNGAE
jgi:phosphoribosylformylglycinamidine (FGAM) synthase-like enzyme